MKTITKYVSVDGAEFVDPKACIARDVLCAEVDKIMSVLQPRPQETGCSFSNGEGYIQHDEAVFLQVRYALNGLGLLASVWPINQAWYRIQCTDDQFREWGQPYFVYHPRVKHVCIKPSED